MKPSVYNLTFLLIIFFCVSAKSETAPHPLTLVVFTNNFDSTKASANDIIFNRLLISDLDKAEEHIEKTKLENKKSPESHAYYFINKAKLEFLTSRNTHSKLYLDSAITIAKNTTKEHQANILLKAGIGLTEMDEFADARKFFDMAMHLAKEINNSTLLINLSIHRAEVLALDWKIEEAFNAIDMADSLINSMEEKPISLLSQHTHDYLIYRRGNLNEALILTKQTALDAQNAQDTLVFKKAKGLESHIFYHLGNYPPAIEGYKILLSLAEKEGHLIDQFDWSIDLSYAYRMMGNFEEAVRYANDCIRLSTASGYEIGKGDAYIRLYEVYHDNKQYQKELAAIDNAMTIYSQLGHPSGVAICENSYGNAYENQGEYGLALVEYKKNLKYRKKQRASFHVIPLYNVGHILILQNRAKEAIPYLEESLAICNREGIIGMKIRNLLALSEAASLLAQQKNAIILVDEAEKLVNTTFYKRMIRDTYKTKANVHAKSQNYREAYEAHQKFKSLEDSLFNESSNERFANLEVKYETRKKEQENDLLKKDLQLEQTKSRAQSQIAFFIGVLLILAIIIALFIGRSYRKLNRKNTLIASQKEQITSRNDKIETLLREVHHRVKNNLQLISSLLDIESLDKGNEVTNKIMQESQGRIATMSLIHQNLYMNHDFTQIALDDYVDQLMAQLLEIHAFQSKIDIDINCDDIQFDIDTMVPLGLIITELVTNAFKYSMTPNDSYYLGISITENNQHECKLLVSDKGPDLPKPFSVLTKKGYGLRLASRLSMQLSGTLQHSYHQGNHFSVVFNMQEDA